MKFAEKILVAVAFLSLCNCADLLKYQPHARTVRKQPRVGGTIALDLDHRDEDHQLAENMMQENCGSKKAQILEENEAVIGSVTESAAEAEKANRHKVGKVFGMEMESGHDGRVTSTSETTQKKEWQINYRCES